MVLQHLRSRSQFHVWSLGFGDSSYGCGVWDFGFQVSGFGGDLSELIKDEVILIVSLSRARGVELCEVDLNQPRAQERQLCCICCFDVIDFVREVSAVRLSR